MPEHEHHLLAEEHPRNHTYQMAVLLVFLIVWIVDSFFLHISTFLREDIPLWLNLGAAVITFIWGVFLIDRSHKALFKIESTGLVSTGIFGRVRNPMYLGIIQIYKAAVIGTLSLLSLIPLFIVVLLYNKMASYEERRLEEKPGKEYSEYKRNVPKWIPKIFLGSGQGN